VHLFVEIVGKKV